MLPPPETDLYHLTLDGVCGVLGATCCHARGLRGQGVRIAMPDTGFAEHPYFEEREYAIERVTSITGMDPERDEQGHGTVACANALALAPAATLIGVRQSDFSVAALKTALAQRPQVVSCSWGWDRDYSSLEELHRDAPCFYREIQDLAGLIREAIADGVVVICAAGNGEQSFPASMPEVISVGGVTIKENGNLTASTLASAFDSNFFPERRVPDICGVVGEGGPRPRRGHIMLPAPRASILEGENLPLGKTTLGWAVTSGTSSAAPQVAGVVALMLSANPELSPSAVKSILCETARPVPSYKTGHGLIDADAACQLSALYARQHREGSGGA